MRSGATSCMPDSLVCLRRAFGTDAAIRGLAPELYTRMRFNRTT